uniref:Signal peptidase complex catalytic subunit SEC11 n=1 Tax=Neogobius melanostomus TaxID=47308 RepID=A0A8C6UWK6_9GOBI
MLSLDFLDDVRRMNKRQLYYQVLNFGMIVSSALMIWKGLMVVTGSESPIVVVLSGSMEPAFHRGDLLFLTNRVEDPIRVGEIVVFRIEGREIPIVHRVLKIHEKENGDIKFLTKGDNNAVDDRGLYKQLQHYLKSHVLIFSSTCHLDPGLVNKALIAGTVSSILFQYLNNIKHY